MARPKKTEMTLTEKAVQLSKELAKLDAKRKALLTDVDPKIIALMDFIVKLEGK
jgi:hypothetical protein